MINISRSSSDKLHVTVGAGDATSDGEALGDGEGTTVSTDGGGVVGSTTGVVVGAGVSIGVIVGMITFDGDGVGAGSTEGRVSTGAGEDSVGAAV
jgi:hypothetical protein